MDKSNLRMHPLAVANLSIRCPDANTTGNDNPSIGAQFKVCGSFAPSFFCNYRVHCRVHYVDQGGTLRNVDNNDIAPNGVNWTCAVNLPNTPAEGDDVYISARLFNHDNAQNPTPMSPTRSVIATFRAATANACGTECP